MIEVLWADLLFLPSVSLSSLVLSPGWSDPSAYHPHSLLSSTTTLLPPSITRPPSAPSNPDVALASSYLPPASQRPARPERSIGQDWSAVGKQFGAVANVLFSAGGVGGGVYWLGGHGHKWSQTKVRRCPPFVSQHLALRLTPPFFAGLDPCAPRACHASVGPPQPLRFPRRRRRRSRPLRHPFLAPRASARARRACTRAVAQGWPNGGGRES